MNELKWEWVHTDCFNLYRLRVVEGWLVIVEGHSEKSMTFVPDPFLKWEPPVKQEIEKL